MRRRSPCLLAFALTLAAAAPASAATITIENRTLTFRAAPGEANDSSATVGGLNDELLDISDFAPITFGAGAESCTLSTAGGKNYASCDPSEIDAVRYEGGDGNDVLSIAGGVQLPGGAVLDGGDGDDRLGGPSREQPGVTLIGGNGHDTLEGGFGPDALDGGPGNDKLDGSHGNDTVRGGDGDDQLDAGFALSADVLDGGPGRDAITTGWYDTNNGINTMSVTFDGVANDGRPSEGDNITAIEVIHTTMVSTLVAAADPVEFKVFNTESGSSKLVGSPGSDNLRSADYADTIQGLGGNDTIEAGYGDDTIDPGPGQDTVNADAGGAPCDFISCRSPHGNDTINARDGERDSIDCGIGTDTAVVDAVDVVASCETVDRGAGGPGGGQKPGGKRCKVPAVKRGSKLARAKRKLRKAGCATTVKKVRSSVRKGRVVKVSPKRGKTTTKRVTIHVSRGKKR